MGPEDTMYSPQASAMDPRQQQNRGEDSHIFIRNFYYIDLIVPSFMLKKNDSDFLLYRHTVCSSWWNDIEDIYCIKNLSEMHRLGKKMLISMNFNELIIFKSITYFIIYLQQMKHKFASSFVNFGTLFMMYEFGSHKIHRKIFCHFIRHSALFCPHYIMSSHVHAYYRYFHVIFLCIDMDFM